MADNNTHNRLTDDAAAVSTIIALLPPPKKREIHHFSDVHAGVLLPIGAGSATSRKWYQIIA